MQKDCPHMSTYTIATGGREDCTDDACRLHLSDCPGEGTHSSGGMVSASYHDCTCSCCLKGECELDGALNLKEYTFDSGSALNCTKLNCGIQFSGCPINESRDNPGISNDTIVFATYHDCTCSCCREEDCPNINYNMFFAGREHCNAETCRGKFYSCPAKGGSVLALYSGPESSNDSSNLFPGYVIALLVLFLGGFFVLSVLFIYRCWQRKKGYRWMILDNAETFSTEPQERAANISVKQGSGSQFGKENHPIFDEKSQEIELSEK